MTDEAQDAFFACLRRKPLVLKLNKVCGVLK